MVPLVPESRYFTPSSAYFGIVYDKRSRLGYTATF